VQDELAKPPPRWMPRPAPAPYELLLGELQHRARAPVAAVGGAWWAVKHPREAGQALRDAVEGLGDAVTIGLKPASATPFNVDVGPHRRFDWLDTDLNAIKEIKSRLGGTVNDVVLAIFTGGVRRFLHRRGIDVHGIDFRAMLPVNVRGGQGEGLGNRVAMLVARLPLDDRDPRTRLEHVIHETRALKRSHQAEGVQAIEELSDATFTTLYVEFARLTAQMRPFNVVVTNVPGPQFPVYLLGSRMTASYPLVPLFKGQALGVALFSYDGHLFWGFNADWDAIPDLHDLVESVESEVANLTRTAAGAPGTLEGPSSEAG
jgi:WS/DGAT/MGAT family acyltransferase